jgi:hypothetical protein
MGGAAAVLAAALLSDAASADNSSALLAFAPGFWGAEQQAARDASEPRVMMPALQLVGDQECVVCARTWKRRHPRI